MKNGKRAGGLMPFDDAFWVAPQHSSDAVESLKRIKGYITLLPWTWTAGQNNDSGMHSALFVENGATPSTPDHSENHLAMVGTRGREEFPA